MKTRILDSALACFTEFGYEHTTIARIRERSHVTNGALFHYFPNKEAIADALYVDAISSFQDALCTLLQRRPQLRRSEVGVRGAVGRIDDGGAGVSGVDGGEEVHRGRQRTGQPHPRTRPDAG